MPADLYPGSNYPGQYGIKLGNSQTISANSAIATWIVTAVVVIGGTIVVPANAAIATYTVPSITVTGGLATITTDTAIVTWTVPSSVITPTITLAANVIPVNWIVSSAIVTLGPSIIAADSAVTTWTVPSPTVVPGAITLSINSAHISWFVPEIPTGVPKLLCSIDLTETWAEHFINNSWASPAEQIAAGFPLYYQPSEITGSYQEVVDYGTILSSIIVNLDWSVEIIHDNVSVASLLEFSDDNVTWTDPVAGPSAFASSVRYLRITINFTGVDTKSLIYFSNLNILLDVKKEIDSGTVTATASDTNGTIVTFNKEFRDIDSITLTAKSIEPIYPVYNFVDIPNPTSFLVLIFDSAGKRITKTISWIARGIV